MTIASQTGMLSWDKAAQPQFWLDREIRLSCKMKPEYSMTFSFAYFASFRAGKVNDLQVKYWEYMQTTDSQETRFKAKL